VRIFPTIYSSENSRVDVAAGYRLHFGKVTSSRGKVKYFVFFAFSSIEILRPNQCTFKWVQEAFSAGVIRPGREAPYLPQTIAEVSETVSYSHSRIRLYDLVFN
jgi:hypothetical protein